MEGRGPRYERETIIILNEQSKEVTIWTASRRKSDSSVSIRLGQLWGQQVITQLAKLAVIQLVASEM
jgi:hypothetical protein